MTENRLAQETSPYLHQHKDNPVHWFPWGDEALETARRENKPILLSVGYAACHWCHVMAHESFENADIAAEMNERFVNIKVDREERPDVDNIYQTALQLLGEQGGWPLTMFLTPDGDPFWGGTYFPPTARWGRPGFSQILHSVSETYKQKPEQIGDNVAAIKDALSKAMAPNGGGALTVEALNHIAANAVRMVDPYRGGMQGAPKFPQPMFFRFLWATHLRTGSAAFADAVTLTLDNICQGGIYDHLGGGFARYSTDDQWLAPHFEKMLYDNALLIELMCDVWQKTRSPLYEARVTETIHWLEREMAAEHDQEKRFGIAGALDADSEGEEGKFYVWSMDEIDEVLGDDAAAFAKVYDANPGGNWEEKIILNRLHTMPWDAGSDARMAPLREKLLERRSTRIRPGRDDKVLADWNGLAIAALARAGLVFDKPEWLTLASDVYTWVKAHMLADDGRLRHSMCAGKLQHPAILDDYANLARAALFLFEITSDGAYLQDAKDWAEIVQTHYGDDDDGGYFMSADDTPDLVAKPKPIFDNAQPSGNGSMAEVLVRLYLITGDTTYQTRAEKLFKTFVHEEPQHNMHHPTLLIAWELMTQGSQVVIIGKPDDAGTRALKTCALMAANRNSIVSVISPDAPLPDGHVAAGKTMQVEKPTAYVCVGQTCGLPIIDPGDLAKALLPTHD